MPIVYANIPQSIYCSRLTYLPSCLGFFHNPLVFPPVLGVPLLPASPDAPFQFGAVVGPADVVFTLVDVPGTL
jgi:hypothetical protein